jgi:hypothetical protein
MGDPYDTSGERTSVLGPTLRFKGELHAVILIVAFRPARE